MVREAVWGTGFHVLTDEILLAGTGFNGYMGTIATRDIGITP